MARQRQLSPASNCHAVVIGGSMAGLLAGRVLADHFDQVTIFERDRFPQEPTFRKGVPQSRHIHVLLRRGQIILEQLFPGLEAELAACGALLLDWGQDRYVLSSRGGMPRFPLGLTTYACSRHLLEWVVRRRLLTHASVRFRQSCDVIDLLGDPSNTGIRGVRLRLREGGHVQECQADLIVDASGRESRTPDWLEALGYARPQETVIDAHLGYASRSYQPPPDLATDWKVMMVRSTPPKGTRRGVIYTVEGNCWIVGLLGVARDYPPIDEAGFLAFAQSLPNSMLYDAIKDAQPLSPIYGFRHTQNRLRHYEQLSRWPEGLVVLGDAVCTFNPVYGQGMTTAALGALALKACLGEQRQHRPGGELTGMPRRFQKTLAEINTLPWLMATGEDFRFPQTEGDKPSPVVRALHGYLDGVKILAVDDQETYLKFLQVMHLLEPLRTLFQPLLALRVLRQTVGRGKEAATWGRGRETGTRS